MLAGVGLCMAPHAASAKLSGPCTGTGTLQQTGKTYDARAVNLVKIPHKGDVTYSGRTQASGKRVAVGQVVLSFPPPIGDVTLGDWGMDGKATGSSGKSGHYHYDVTDLIAGIKFPISGYDKEPGLPLCSGSVVLQIDGTSKVAWASLVFTVIAAAGVALSIRARSVG
jgi:hypothetical protein